MNNIANLNEHETEITYGTTEISIAQSIPYVRFGEVQSVTFSFKTAREVARILLEMADLGESEARKEKV